MSSVKLTFFIFLLIFLFIIDIFLYFIDFNVNSVSFDGVYRLFFKRFYYWLLFFSVAILHWIDYNILDINELYAKSISRKGRLL